MKQLPSRFALPLIGDTLAFARDPSKLFRERARELGPVFKLHLFGHPTACFAGPEAFALLLDDQNVVRKGANPPHVEEIFNPRSVPFLDGAARRRRKRLLMQAFDEASLEGYLPLVDQTVARFASKWVKANSFSWVPELHAFGFSVAGALFVGADPLRDDPAIENAFAQVADGLLSLPLRLPGTRFTRALRARDFLRVKVQRAVKEQLATRAQSSNVLARLVAARDGDEKLGEDELCIETFHFFGAYSAVIGGLSFLASCLGRFPEVARRAREEVRRELGEAPLSLPALGKLSYLDAVIKEARRALPVLPITFFATVARDLTFEGVHIPAGHKALGCLEATLLDETIFAEPERFDPDRWLNPTERQQQAFIPHGGGVHVEGHRCAGENLAVLMLKVFAARLLQKYHWEFTADQDFAPTKGKLFATPVGGLVTRLHPLDA